MGREYPFLLQARESVRVNVRRRDLPQGAHSAGNRGPRGRSREGSEPRRRLIPARSFRLRAAMMAWLTQLHTWKDSRATSRRAANSAGAYLGDSTSLARFRKGMGTPSRERRSAKSGRAESTPTVMAGLISCQTN